jgi:Pin2-interacting protein X1
MSSTHYQGVQKESAGYKLLKGMGWEEGEGLGANKQGLKEHIRVKKKFENWGVGAVESHNRASNWSSGMNEFHRVLSSLSEITSKHANGSSSSGTDDEEDMQVNNAPEERGARDERKKKKKKDTKERKRDTKKDKKRKRKGKDEKGAPAASDSGDDAPSEKDKIQEKKRATHIGRFKRRESSKMVKGYSTSDLAAILGEDPFAKQAASIRAITNADARDVPDDAGADRPSSSDEDDGREPPTTAAATACAVRLDTWWSGYFVVGPRAGSRGEKIAIKKKTGFSEADQEALDTWAHSHATHGRVGLGRSSMPKKVAGARWTGTKTKLGSDSDGDSDEEDAPEIAVDDDDGDGIQVVLPKKMSKGGRGKDAPGDQGILQRIRDALSKEKSRTMKVKAVAKAVGLKKDALLETLQDDVSSGLKLSKSKSKVSLVD